MPVLLDVIQFILKYIHQTELKRLGWLSPQYLWILNVCRCAVPQSLVLKHDLLMYRVSHVKTPKLLGAETTHVQMDFIQGGLISAEGFGHLRELREFVLPHGFRGGTRYFSSTPHLEVLWYWPSKIGWRPESYAGNNYAIRRLKDTRTAAGTRVGHARGAYINREVFRQPFRRKEQNAQTTARLVHTQPTQRR